MVDYEAARDGVRLGMAGSYTKVASPTLPSLSVAALTYGEEIKGLDLGESSTLTYTINGLPPGITNESPFLPDEIPGIYAWYDADSNGSLITHASQGYDRNDTVALDNLLLYLPFDETNGSLAYGVSGNGHHGRLIDQAQWVGGKVGGAFLLMEIMMDWYSKKLPAWTDRMHFPLPFGLKEIIK